MKRLWLAGVTLIFIEAGAAGQQLTTMVPGWAIPGQTIDAFISCDAEHTFDLPAMVEFYPAVNIQASNIYLVDVSNQRLGLTIFIPAGTPCGSQTVTVTTNSYEFVGSGIFSVCEPCPGGCGNEPSITSIEPNKGQAGESLKVKVTGSNTHFAAASSVLSLGNDISVGSITVTSETELEAQITISDSASASSRDVTVTTGSEVAVGKGLFTVTAPPLELSPDSAAQGETLSEVVVSGGTGFGASTTVDLGEGISIGSISLSDSTSLRLGDVRISLDAPVGYRTLRLRNPFYSVEKAFTVLQGPQTQLLSITPNHADAGHPGLPVLLVGQHTHFSESDKQVSLSAAHSAVKYLQAVSSTELQATVVLGRNALPGLYDVTVALGVEAGCSNCEKVVLEKGFEISEPAVISAIDPEQLLPGEKVELTVIASGGNFQGDQVQVLLDPPEDVEILQATVLDGDHLQLEVTIGEKASGQPRDMTVVTGSEVAFGQGVFDVFHPALAGVSPTSGMRGTSVHLTVMGMDVEFQGTPSLSFSGTGIEVLSVALDPQDSSRLKAEINIAADAPLGARDVTVSSGGIELTAPRAFAVIAAPWQSGGEQNGCSCSAAGPQGANALVMLLMLLAGLRRFLS